MPPARLYLCVHCKTELCHHKLMRRWLYRTNFVCSDTHYAYDMMGTVKPHAEQAYQQANQVNTTAPCSLQI
jgi:hypothetical protein